MFRSALLLAAAATLSACAKPAEKPLEGRWVDLTHDLAEDSPFWPTAEGFRHEVASYGKTPGGWFYSSYNLTLSEHGGTHLDAPIHFAEGKQTADQMPLDRLIGPAAVIDVSAASAANPDYRFTVADLEQWERSNGRLPDGAILLFNTGYSSRWPDRKAYMGTDERGPDAVAKLHFPGLSAELAQFLVSSARSPRSGSTLRASTMASRRTSWPIASCSGPTFPGSRMLPTSTQLPPKGATVVALPTKIRGGSGAPLRIVALVPQ